MDVIVNVLGTEAMISVAAGTVAELKLGVFNVGFSADGAFVAVGQIILFAASLFRRFLKVYCLRCISRLERTRVRYEVVAAENEKVQQCYNRQERQHNAARDKFSDNGVNKERAVKQSKPFYFYGYNKEQPHGKFGE